MNPTDQSHSDVEPKTPLRDTQQVSAHMVRIAAWWAHTRRHTRKLRAIRFEWGMDWKKSRQILVTSVLVLYAAVTVVGLVRSWSLEGNVSDRQVELNRLHQQMLEEQIRTERLEKQIDDLERRPEFRINTIRQELQMLLPGEHILHFG